MAAFFKNKLRKFNKMKSEIEEEDLMDLEGAEEPESLAGEQKTFWLKFGRHYGTSRRVHLLMVAGLCLALICALLFLYLHVGTDYFVLDDEKRTDINGTSYREFGDKLLKYSSDGVTCISGDHVLWNSTFSMQRPVLDLCKTATAVADMNGTHVYVFSDSGQIGQFQTSLPIEKIRVAKQGVVAAVLNDGDVTWINIYDSQGKEIAKNRTSLADSGYPLDIDISPDGMKVMVSYLCVTQGIMNTKICFYNFDSVGQSEVNNMVTSQTCENAVAPEVRFLGEETAVAFLSNGFCVFTGKQIPELKKKTEFDEEIMSVFSDENNFGFVFKSDKEDHKYRVQLYDKGGKQIMKTYFDLDYKQVKLADGNLMFFNDKAFEIYNTGGRKKFSGAYDRAILDIIKLKGFRKYMILSRDYVSTIRLK